jgi:chorismate mutase-like protein
MKVKTSKLKVKSLESLRKEIDQIDQQILELIAKRLEIVNEIGRIKKQTDKQVRNPQREQELLDKLTKKAEKFGISREIVERIWKIFFEIAYKLEK